MILTGGESVDRCGCHRGLGTVSDSNDRLMRPVHRLTVNGIVVTLVTPPLQRWRVLNRKFTDSFKRRFHEEGVTSVSVVPTLLEFFEAERTCALSIGTIRRDWWSRHCY